MPQHYLRHQIVSGGKKMLNTQNINPKLGAPQEGSPSKGVQAIFDMEAIITEMMREYMDQNSSAAQLQGNIGELMENSINEKYEKICEELKKEEEEKPKHWWQKVGDFFKDAGEIIGHLVAAAAEASVGDISGAKAQWKDVEENPELATLIKALTYVVAAITIVAGCVTGNFELVAVTAVLLAVTQSGILSKIESHIGSAGGKLAFDIAIVIVATLATAGTGALETVADTAGEEIGTEMTNFAAKETEQGAEEAAQKTVTQFNGAKALGLGAMGFGSALGSVNLSQDLVEVFDPNGKNKQKIEEILQIVQDALAVIAAVAGGVGSIAASSEETTGILTEKLSTLANKLLPENLSEMVSGFTGNLSESIQNNLATISKILQGGEFIGNGSAAILGGANATNSFRIAGIEKEVGKLKGALEKLTNSLQQNSQDIKSNDQVFQNNLQTFSQMIGNFSHYFNGYAAQAYELLG